MSNWISRTAAFFCLIWLFQLPEVEAFLDRLTTRGAFWDWRLIAVASIWTLQAMYRHWRRIKAVEDEEILHFYTEAPSR